MTSLHVAMCAIVLGLLICIGVLQFRDNKRSYYCNWSDYWIMYALALIYAISYWLVDFGLVV